MGPIFPKLENSKVKTTIYVGGLEENVSEKVLYEVFNTFGNIKDVNIPLNIQNEKHRGFGFVEFVEEEDAAAAIDNMHKAELMGKVLRVNYAQTPIIKGGNIGWSHQPVWADSDYWLDRLSVIEKNVVK